MPYIKSNERIAINKLIKRLNCKDVGQLNYTISYLCNKYLKIHKLSYSTINDIIGVLSCVQLELYRRIAADYEDKKCQLNGDVFTIKK